MLFHNHPSGNLTPSEDDVRITDRMEKLYSLADIELLDHIIIGTGDSYYSFRENDVLPVSRRRFARSVEDLKLRPLKLGAAEDGLISGGVMEDMPAPMKNEDRVKAITDRLEAGIAALFESEQYRAYLSTMAKFHSYSLNNTLLIAMQKPDATLVAGYLSS